MIPAYRCPCGATFPEGLGKYGCPNCAGDNAATLNPEDKVNASDFASWVAQMKSTRRWSRARCSRELGCGINQIAVWSANGAPPYIALACAALAFGLPPWRSV